MAIKRIVQSDLSGTELDEGQAATITVEGHPAVGGPVELDVSQDEAKAIDSTTLDLVTLTLYDGGSKPRRVVMDVKSFNGLFAKGVNVDDTLKDAHRAGKAVGQPRRRSAASKGERLDYTSPEHAGKIHRGRVTEAEAEWVRNNQSKASRNRQAQTGEPIDFEDAAEKKRYGL